MRGLFLWITPVPLRSTKSADIGQTIRSSARGEKITVDSCRRKDDVGATLVVALFPADVIDSLTNPVGARGAQVGRPRGSPLQRAILENAACAL